MKHYEHPDYGYVDVVEIKKDEIERIDLVMGKEPKERLMDWYNRQDVKPDLLINAGFFGTKSGNSIFNLIDDGDVKSKNQSYKWGMYIDKAHKDIKYGSCENPNVADFVSAYPPLVDGGKSCAPWKWATEINYKALRTMIGYNADTIYAVTISKPGMKFDPMADLMIDIGCTNAINLDGGGSSRMMVNGKVVNAPTENRAVDSMIAVWLKKSDATPEPTPAPVKQYRYTVQLGSFSKYSNAKNLVAELKIKGYDCFIRTNVVNGKTRYSVQLGSFSVKANADRLLTTMKSAGYDCFVKKVEA